MRTNIKVSDHNRQVILRGILDVFGQLIELTQSTSSILIMFGIILCMSVSDINVDDLVVEVDPRETDSLLHIIIRMPNLEWISINGVLDKRGVNDGILGQNQKATAIKVGV